jgi:rhodanese-related sulfurtransferase
MPAPIRSVVNPGARVDRSRNQSPAKARNLSKCKTGLGSSSFLAFNELRRKQKATRVDTIFLANWKGALMAHQHPPRFLKIVDDARTRVRETNVDEVKKRLDRGDKFMLVDVREESEYAKDHLPGAIHLGKGVIERDIEARVPDLKAEMVLYCGGGFRSALAADNLQKMGYTNVISMDGGVRGWREKGFPLTKE